MNFLPVLRLHKHEIQLRATRQASPVFRAPPRAITPRLGVRVRFLAP